MLPENILQFKHLLPEKLIQADTDILAGHILFPKG
jgi:hypothetical protein